MIGQRRGTPIRSRLPLALRRSRSSSDDAQFNPADAKSSHPKSCPSDVRARVAAELSRPPVASATQLVLELEALIAYGLIISPLEDALEGSTGEARFLISAALVVLGSPLGTEDVLRAVRAGDPYVHLAVRVLTAAKNNAAGPLIQTGAMRRRPRQVQRVE